MAAKAVGRGQKRAMPSKFWLKTAEGLVQGVGETVGSPFEFAANKIAERDSRMTMRAGCLVCMIFLC